MPCIHGLDENNCPSCRIIRSSLPKSASKINELYSNPLKSETSYFHSNNKQNKRLINEKNLNLPDLHKTSINIISTPNLLNKVPSFKNKMLEERLGQIEVSKSEIFDVLKKVTLASPEWKPKKKE